MTVRYPYIYDHCSIHATWVSDLFPHTQGNPWMAAQICMGFCAFLTFWRPFFSQFRASAIFLFFPTFLEILRRAGFPFCKWPLPSQIRQTNEDMLREPGSCILTLTTKAPDPQPTIKECTHTLKTPLGLCPLVPFCLVWFCSFWSATPSRLCRSLLLAAAVVHA